MSQKVILENKSLDEINLQPVNQEITSLKTSINNIKDFIVQQGVIGNFIYRKYNSGMIEAWGEYSVSASIASPEGSMYYQGYTLTFPSGLFSKAPRIISSLVNLSGGYACYWMANDAGNITTTSAPGWFFSDVICTSGTIKLNVYLIQY